MKDKKSNKHFHSPSAASTRFAAAVDLLRNKRKFIMSRSTIVAECAACGKKIRPSLEHRKRVARVVNNIIIDLVFLLALAGGVLREPVPLVISIALQASRPLLQKYVLLAINAFTRWEVEPQPAADNFSSNMRTDDLLEDDLPSWYSIFLPIHTFVLSVAILIVVLTS